MPQPYKGKWSMSSSTLEMRPKLATHVGIIASMWTQIELTLALIVAKMLNAEADIAGAMLLPVRSEATRFAIINAVAEDRLTPDMQEELKQLKKRIDNTGNERNRVVHGLWAHSENEDTLILVSQKEMLKVYSGIITKLANQKPVEVKDYAEMLEYSEKDFIQIESNIADRIKETAAFFGKLHTIAL